MTYVATYVILHADNNRERTNLVLLVVCFQIHNHIYIYIYIYENVDIERVNGQS